ncbi:uncharacterized protein EI90DRAFT_3125102 [Cantharellus anzutake]|uniref:uncharacterized protein n=1 Tax=Cantharellus anzutake TaxID=1750568 RepID=UPI001906528E|nr:uncharacterized protein EI90DRAFT_3125102 [Cantharellus anzutake]KAF8329839.1 hypothetical protein EI90DRAFT_3125102 [Cantharellus anzutake]
MLDLRMRPRRVAGTPSAPWKVNRSMRTPVPKPMAGNSQLSSCQAEPLDAPLASNSSPNQAGATPHLSACGEVDTQAEGPSLTPGDDPKEVLTGGDPVPDVLGQQAPDPVLPIDKPPNANTKDVPEPGTSTLPPPDPGDPPGPSAGPDPIVIEATNKRVPLGAPIAPEPPPPDGEGIQPDPPIAANALGTAAPPSPT